ncbi:MAG: HEAT repeat domain-containing protein [Rhodospirillales bacterium]
MKDPASTEFAKAKCCQRLAIVGTPEAVPVLASMLTDERFGAYARIALQLINHSSVDDALRDALSKAKGGPLVGVINSIRYRKDAKAVPALAKLLYHADPLVAEAAAWALGTIGGAEAAKPLQRALTRTKGRVLTAIAGAGLVCAEGFLSRGEREATLALYDTLSGSGVPKPVRLAAMHGAIAAEISLSRPR